MSDTTPHFDCDARLRAITAPELTLGGIRYGGQLLSIVEWMPFLERYEELQRRQAAHQAAIATNRALDEAQDVRPRVTVPPAPTLREVFTFHADFLRAVFPRALRPYWWMRGWGSTYDLVSRLQRAPDPAMLSEVFTLFFGCQLRAMQGKDEPLEAEPSENQPPAPGSTSSGKTTPALDDAAANASSV